MNHPDADLIASAYTALLRLSHGEARNRLQGVMATLRDELASFEANDREIVQDRFEAVARLFKQERLGQEFEKVLFDNIWELYARS